MEGEEVNAQMAGQALALIPFHRGRGNVLPPLVLPLKDWRERARVRGLSSVCLAGAPKGTPLHIIFGQPQERPGSG